MEYDSVIKKNGIMPFAATRMQVEIIILSKVSQAEKDTYHMISLNVKSKVWHTGTYLRKRNKRADMKDRLVVAKQEGGWERLALGVWG